MKVPKRGDIWSYENESVETHFIVIDDPVYGEIPPLVKGDVTDTGYSMSAWRFREIRGYSAGQEIDVRFMRDSQKSFWRKIS